jgi:hypothetical protein
MDELRDLEVPEGQAVEVKGGRKPPIWVKVNGTWVDFDQEPMPMG